MKNDSAYNDRTQEALKIFTDSGALLSGHFLLTSGRHSDRYMQCAQVLKYPEHTEKLARWLAADFADDRIDLVIGPAIGGIIVAYETGRQLGVPAIFSERDSSGSMALRRGFEIPPGQRVLVVEDVTTTGGSVREVMQLVKESGGIVAGVGVLVDRSNGQVDFGVKQRAVITMEVLSWDAAECPLCRGGSEPVKPGSRK